MLKAKFGNILVYGLTGMFVTVFVTMAVTGFISLMLFLFSPWALADNMTLNEKENAQCLTCHGKVGFSTSAAGKKISLYVNAEKFRGSIHGTNKCTSCHPGLSGIPHKKPVYGAALSRQVRDRCQACHSNIAKIYLNSVHGQLAQAGRNTAYCQDCHGSHLVYKVENPDSLVYWRNVPATCTRCHNGNVKKSYEYSFHGISVSKGYDKSPNCANCHGVHDILGPADPKSSVSKQNTARTCAKCHAQAAAGFANGFEHRVPEDRRQAFSMWLLYKIFLGLIIFDVTMSGSIVLWELSRKFRAAGDHRQ